MSTALVKPEAFAQIGPVDPPLLVTPAYDETVYSYGFEDYAALPPVPAQQVYSFGFETWAATTVPAQIVFTDSFESLPISWTLNSGTTSTYTGPTSLTAYVKDGSYAALFSRSSAAGAMTATKVISGLTIGRSYTASVWGRGWPGATITAASIGASGIGNSTPIALGTSGLTQMLFTFTATATSHTLVLSATTGGVGSRHAAVFDYVTLTRDAYTEGSGTPNDGLDGWTGGTNVASPRRSGARAFQGSTPSRTFTGLEVGRSYTLSGWRYNGSAWSAVSNQFTATASTMTRSITISGATHWDNLTLTRDAYTIVTNNGLDGWTTGTVQSAVKRSGSYALQANAPARAFTGLVVGHQYTLRAWHSPLSGGAWTLFSETFTAASTSQSRTLNVAGTRNWDDVELIHHVPPVTTPNAPLPVSGGSATLDESWSPYVQASVEVPLTDLAFLERIDPRDDQRVQLLAGDAIGQTDREFDLGLRGRTVDHKAGKVTLELASDEALLFDKRRLAATVDSTPRTFESSLRGVCSWALGKIGANLLAGTADADLTATWDATNLQTNPSAGANLDGWTASGGTLARVTGGIGHPDGTPSSVRAIMSAGATGGLYFYGGDDSSIAGGVYNVRISGKQLYRVSAWVRTSVSKTIRLSVQQRNSGNTPAGANLNGPDFTTTANTWHRLTYVFQAYPESVRMGVYCYLTSGTWSAGQTIDMTGVMVTEGTTDTPYFDGSTTIRTDLYAYSWSGTPHLSTSERKAFFLRPPELFDWKPGQSLNDFLRPLVEASGLRLFCDEHRVWRLVDPTSYEVPGYVVVQAKHNATEGTDTIDRNTEDWATGILVVYRWTDAEGTRREAFDFAGTDSKVVTIERESEYPGPGAAAYFLNSRTGRGRAQEVTALVDFRATPTNDVSIDLPGTVKQTGKVRRVTFGLSDGLMDLGTRGLIDTLDGSWAAWNPTQKWAEVNPTLKWKDA